MGEQGHGPRAVGFVGPSQRLDIAVDPERLTRKVAPRRRDQEHHHEGNVLGSVMRRIEMRSRYCRSMAS